MPSLAERRPPAPRLAGSRSSTVVGTAEVVERIALAVDRAFGEVVLGFSDDGTRLQTPGGKLPRHAAYVVDPGFIPSPASIADMVRDRRRLGSRVVYGERRWRADIQVRSRSNTSRRLPCLAAGRRVQIDLDIPVRVTAQDR